MPTKLKVAETLSKYGLTRVGYFRLVKGNFSIEILDHVTAELEQCIYAFVVGHNILRIGSSKAPLKNRFREWERDVTNALKGKRSPTPTWEAKAWREALKQHSHGIVFARKGTLVVTPVGKINAYMDEESVLIGRYKPPLNRSKHR